MKLTVIRLQHCSAQDQIDLQKIWPLTAGRTPAPLQAVQQLYAARFNDRLLAAVCVVIAGENGHLSRLEVREVTRRRGVGLYLLEEVLAQNPQVCCWSVDNDGSADPAVIAAFMQAAGFTAGDAGWHKTGNNAQ